MSRNMILKFTLSLMVIPVLESVCLAKASDAYLPWDQAIAYQSALRDAAKNAGLKFSAELLEAFDNCSQEDLQITPLAKGIDAAIDRIEARNRELGEELNLRRLERDGLEREKGRFFTEKSRLENLMRTSPNDPSLPAAIEAFNRWLADLEKRIPIWNSINDATKNKLAVQQREVAAFNAGELQQYNTRVLAWQATVRELRNRQLQERQRILDHLKTRNPNEPPPELGIPTPKIVAAGTATVIVVTELHNPVNVIRYSSMLSNEVVGWARQNPELAKQRAEEAGMIVVGAGILVLNKTRPILAKSLGYLAATPLIPTAVANVMNAKDATEFQNSKRWYTRFQKETNSYKDSLEKSGRYTAEQIGEMVSLRADLLIQSFPASPQERKLWWEVSKTTLEIGLKKAAPDVLNKTLGETLRTKIASQNALLNNATDSDKTFLNKHGVRPRGTTKLFQSELNGGFDHHP